MNRRQFLRRSAMAGAGVAVATWAGWPDPALGAATCLFGARTDSYANETTQQATLDFERKIGRKIAITRQYSGWERTLPDNYSIWAAPLGHIPFMAWHAIKIDKSAVSWSSIANGSKDATIRAQAEAIKAWGHPAYFCFHHEPENDPQCGNANQFKAAWAQVRKVFNQVGVPKLTWVASFMASTYKGGHDGIDAWMPPDADILFSADAYNRGSCDPKPGWRSFSEIFLPAYTYAATKGHGLFIGEYGCVEDNACGNTSGSATRKAQWFTDATATIKTWPRLKAVVYSNTEWAFHGQDVNYRVDTTNKSLNSFKAMGLDPYFT